MVYEYKLTCNPPYSILLSGENVQHMLQQPGASLVEDPFGGADMVGFPFTNEHALMLRQFLKGRSVELTPRDKAILKRLADDPEASTNKELLWSKKIADLRELPGIKKSRTIKNGFDLLHYLPLRYIDKTNPTVVSGLTLGEWAVIPGVIANDPVSTETRAGSLVTIVVEDIHGGRISGAFFKQHWLAWQFKKGEEVVMYGNYSEYVNKRDGRTYPQLTNPKVDKLTSARGTMNMIPIYPQKQQNKSWEIQNAQTQMIRNLVYLEDPVPELLIDRYGFMTRDEAYRSIHFPESTEEVERARDRIAFDEFIRLQVYLELRRQKVEARKATIKNDWTLADKFEQSLPFTFTEGQRHAIQEIGEDMGTPSPMYRLLQADVGAGKTEIATVAALLAVANQEQVAVLAPTDILAVQLAQRFQKTFDNAELDVRVEVINGRIIGKRRQQLLEEVANGSVDVLVGTHLLSYPEVQFRNLGLAVVDEQHKFGTEQRTALLEKAPGELYPDFLMMSATPIPRTVSQVVFGDMDITRVEGLPEGRQVIETDWVSEPGEAWERIREQVAQGRQAYVVVALVDEDNKTIESLQAATEVQRDLALNVFPDLNVGMLHGKLKKNEKQDIIDSFYSGETDVLVATSVVEVGVNVPNATVMVVLNCDRFGIASLHQIRGRVGRGSHKSWCYLVGDTQNPDTEDRLNALVESNDGFWLAERDLEIRGEGSLFGQLQSGASDLFVGNLREHRHLLEIAKRAAKQAAKSPALVKEVEAQYVDAEIQA